MKMELQITNSYIYLTIIPIVLFCDSITKRKYKTNSSK